MAAISENDVVKSKSNTVGTKHEFKARMGGQTRTVFLRPLRYSVDESDISLFVKQASLSSPLRVDLFCHRYPNEIKNDSNNINENNDDDEEEDIDVLMDSESKSNLNNNNNNNEYCAYAYVTFATHDDCELVVHGLNGSIMETNDKSVSSVPVRVE